MLRHGQESIASLCHLHGFGDVPSHHQVCQRLASVVNDPASTIAEYIRRDIANIVLGNKDNHARNTAIQRKADGTVTLTPLFDFAPMWLHPDGIARRIRWDADDGGSPYWASVIAQACDAEKLDSKTIRAQISLMAAPLSTLLSTARALGIAQEFLDPLQKTVAQVRAQLEVL